MGMDARFEKYPKSKFNVDTNATESDLWEHPVSPYEAIAIGALEFLRNEREVHDRIANLMSRRYDSEFVNSADYRITEKDVKELLEENVVNYSARVEEILSEVLADMVKSKYKGQALYDYYYTANW